MKEDLLRKMIQNEIISSLQEAPIARSAVGAKLVSVEKMAGVKMLKKALGTGSPEQQAAGLLKVIQAISGNNPSVGKRLSRMLMKDPDMSSDVSAEAPVEERVSSALSSRMGRLDKTQAMKNMVKSLKTKPASQQAEFVADFVKNLDLKGNITLLIKKIRQAN